MAIIIQYNFYFIDAVSIYFTKSNYLSLKLNELLDTILILSM